MADPIADIDAQIALAVEYRTMRRRLWARSPNNDTTAAADEAQAELDRLLEQRHRMQQQQRKD